MTEVKLKKSDSLADFSNVSRLSSEEKDSLILKLKNECDAVKKELHSTQQERDNLICEVNKLKFELQISDLKRLREDGKYGTR